MSMRFSRLLCAATALGLLGLQPVAAEPRITDLPALIPKLLPQVVNISFLKHSASDDKSRTMPSRPPAQSSAQAPAQSPTPSPSAPPAPPPPPQSLAPTGGGVGTGFIVDALGIICTNRHVTDGGDEIYVTLSDNTRLRAELIYRSPDLDLALLRVNPPGLLTPVTFGDSDAMVQGTPVIAIGNPLGLGGTVTTGIVSARDRDIKETALDSFMQIDASINPGNSGGPLFNEAGQLIGMNTALFAVSGDGAPSGSIGLNFSIPGNDVRLVLEMLRDKGKVSHGLLGATVQDMSADLAEAVGLKSATGAIVTYVVPSSPAVTAGLRNGDIILQFNDDPIANSRAARRFITSHPGASNVAIHVLREGVETTLTANLKEVSMGPERVDMAMQPVAKMRLTAMDLGVEAGPMTEALRARYKIAPEIDGIVITAVIEKGLGAYLGLQQGGVLIQAQGTPLHTAQDFIGVAERALQQNRGKIPLLVSDQSGSRWIALPVSR